MKTGKYCRLACQILLVTVVLWPQEPDPLEIWENRAGSCVVENSGEPDYLHIHEELCYDVSGNIRCRLPQREEAGQSGDCHVHKPECFAAPDAPKTYSVGANGYTWAGILSALGGLVALELQQKTGCAQKVL